MNDAVVLPPHQEENHVFIFNPESLDSAAENLHDDGPAVGPH